MAQFAFGRANRIGEKRLAMRKQLWPAVADTDLWIRQHKKGFVTVPRGMPLIMSIMDDLSKGQPVSATYFELWCRAFDECFVTLNPMHMAVHAGFTGQRAVRSWTQRMQRLEELGFISIKPGSAGKMGYALILNPYKIILNLHLAKAPGLLPGKYNALFERAIEIGADDLTPPSGDVGAVPSAATTN